MPKRAAAGEIDAAAAAAAPSKRAKRTHTVAPRRSTRDVTAAGSEFFGYASWPLPVERMRALALSALTTAAEGVPLAVSTEHPERGRCVHAVKAIAAGAFVREYGGDLLTTNEQAEARAHHYATTGEAEDRDRSFMFYFAHAGRQYCIDATESPRIAKLINHSRMHPNLRPIKCVDPATRLPHILLMALRRIEAGEELFFDYGEIDPGVRARLPFLDT